MPRHRGLGRESAREDLVGASQGPGREKSAPESRRGERVRVREAAHESWRVWVECVSGHQLGVEGDIGFEELGDGAAGFGFVG